MRALFVTNQLKTGFYSPWARAMEAAGAVIFWISTGERWTSYLVGQGWDRTRILDLSELGSRWTAPFKPSAEQASRIQRIDEGAEIGLKNALIMDRELALNPGWHIEAYGQVVALEIERFVLDNDIRFAFGEDTWAPEIITSAVMQANGRHFHAPHTIRIPSERFAFFPGVFQKRIDVFCEQPDVEHRAIARQALANLRERGQRPYYFALNMNQNRLRNHWLDEAWRAVMQPAGARFDHTMPSLRTRVGRRLASVLSGALAKRTGAFEAPPETAERPFALFLLQKQPESSVDVIGAPFTNQYEIIQALTRLLPFGWEMWVKEHPNAIGDRSPAYYRDLRRLPGIRLIDPFADTHRLISRAGLTVSISGTACFEAGLLGRPAITIAEMYFGRVLLRNGFNPFQASHGDFAAIVDEAAAMTRAQAGSAIEDYLAWNVAQSFPGMISDPANVPSVIDPENVRNVADATISFLQRLSR
ncbi:MAG: hypothetical protein U1E61_11090 [Bradyrhizobium sp.]